MKGFIMDSTYLYLGIITVAIFLFLIIVGNRITKLKANTFFIGFFAVIFGLLIGSLAYLPLSRLPSIYGVWVPVVFYIAMVSFSVWLFLSRQKTIEQTFENIGKIFNVIASLRPQLSGSKAKDSEILVDTSVLIDGRIVDIARTGFISGKMVVPKFVLSELQNIADSDDSQRRAKGRLGLSALEELKKMHSIRVVSSPEELKSSDYPVDEKLVQMAKSLKSKIVTNDFNLNKVAKVEGVLVLNINELSQAVRPVLIPGEELKIKLIQEGKEKKQGVGYLADGTMIVVEDGAELIGKSVKVEIKRIIQTTAGKMYFAILKNN